MRHQHGINAQQGVAIITALLVVVLAAAIASILLAQQSDALTRVERAAERAQLNLYTQPTLDWARSSLRDLQKQSNDLVHLKQAWSQGLVARPIDTAVASGVLRDEQAKFNLNNLVDADGKQRKADMDFFRRLLKTLKLSEDLAYNIADWIDKDDDVSSPSSGESGYYISRSTPYRASNRALISIDELYRIVGIDEKIMRALRPFVTVLPPTTAVAGANDVRTKINLNTTSREMLTVLFPDTASDVLDDVIVKRDQPYSDIGDFSARNPKIKSTTMTDFADTKSRYFEASFAVSGQHAQIRQSALLQQQAPSRAEWPVIIWIKEE